MKKKNKLTKTQRFRMTDTPRRRRSSGLFIRLLKLQLRILFIRNGRERNRSIDARLLIFLYRNNACLPTSLYFITIFLAHRQKYLKRRNV